MQTLLLPVTPDSLALAGKLIRAGKLVAFPTETVYGLGADALFSEAVAADGLGLAVMNRLSRAAGFHILDADESQGFPEKT